MRIFVNEFCGHPFQLELSRELARRGHYVEHVYFADNDTTPKGSTEARAGDSERLVIDGLHIRRKFSKHSLLTRLQADVEYGNVVAERMRRFRPDIVISANMPLAAQDILQRATHAEHARFIFWLQDVYSVAIKFVLKKKSRMLSWLGGAYYERLEKKLLKQSDEIICIAPSFASFLNDWGIAGPKVHVIENWAPIEEVRPGKKQNAWAKEHGVSNDFCFVYSGTLGMKHRPELLLELARHLEAEKNGRLVVVAGGAGADWLAKNSTNVDPSVLKLLPFQPYERVADVMASADALITLLDSEAGSFAVPSKTLAYLCAGRAVIAAAPESNEAALMVKRARAGLVVSPDDTKSLIAAAGCLLSNKRLCVEYGVNARAYAERTFGIAGIADRFLAAFGPVPIAAASQMELERAGNRYAIETGGAI